MILESFLWDLDLLILYLFLEYIDWHQKCEELSLLQ